MRIETANGSRVVLTTKNVIEIYGTITESLAVARKTDRSCPKEAIRTPVKTPTPRVICSTPHVRIETANGENQA